MSKNIKIFLGLALIGLFLSPTSLFAWWKPGRFENITWHWQLSGELDLNKNVDMYDVDLFDTSSNTIQLLKSQGKKVMCYFSAGALEFTNSSHDNPLRPDNPAFPLDEHNWDFVGNEVENYDRELWLDIRANNVWKIKPTIEGRFNLAKAKGCDGVEVDNVNEYEVDDDDPTEPPVQNESYSPGTTGFDPIITATDQLAYNRWLAQQAHARDLSIGFKNDIYQADQLVNYFDWALNEQCYEYTSPGDDYYECDYYNSFDDAGKAVFGVEYNLSKSRFCYDADSKGRYWARKNIDLDAYQDLCVHIPVVLSGPIPIYRLYNTRTGFHLYAKGEADKYKILNKWHDFEFTDRGPAFWANADDNGTTPIYRLYNTRTGAQLYTRGQVDRDKILNKWSDFEFTDGGPAFYTSLAQQPGLTPIYRLYNTRTGAHLYTRGQADRDKVLSKWHDFEFTDGGPAFWAKLSN